MGVPVSIDVPLYVKAEQEGKTSEKALEISKVQDEDNYTNEPFKE